MLGWGSWANTQKLAGKDQWRFELYYWDYAIGVLLFGLIYAFTFGSVGSAGQSALAKISTRLHIMPFITHSSAALFSTFRTSCWWSPLTQPAWQSLFPSASVLALVIGTVESYLQTPKGNPALVRWRRAHRFRHDHVEPRLPQAAAKPPERALARPDLRHPGRLHYGFVLSATDASSISANFNTEPIQPGMLTPYVALAVFGVGVFASNLLSTPSSCAPED